MRFKYAVYCSGHAGRVIKFYKKYSLSNYPLEFVIYDGENIGVKEELTKLFNKKVIFYKSDIFRTQRLLNQKFSDDLLSLLLDNSVDYLFCFGEKILKPDLINIYINKIINFHPSLLPKYPGLKAIDQALESNEEFLGNTAHFIDAGIDTGPIILQAKISRDKFINYDSVLDLQIHMLKKIWDIIESGQLKTIQ